MSEYKIERVWAMPSKQTFSIQPISKLLKEELGEYLDVFPYPYKHDALEFLKSLPDQSETFVAYDPPYSPRQLKECYDSLGMSVGHHSNAKYWSNCKDEINRIIKTGGKIISFGWNTNGMGKGRGFKITRILLVSHGGMHNDTICMVNKKCRVF